MPTILSKFRNGKAKFNDATAKFLKSRGLLKTYATAQHTWCEPAIQISYNRWRCFEDKRIPQHLEGVYKPGPVLGTPPKSHERTVSCGCCPVSEGLGWDHEDTRYCRRVGFNVCRQRWQCSCSIYSIHGYWYKVHQGPWLWREYTCCSGCGWTGVGVRDCCGPLVNQTGSNIHLGLGHPCMYWVIYSRGWECTYEYVGYEWWFTFNPNELCGTPGSLNPSPAEPWYHGGILALGYTDMHGRHHLPYSWDMEDFLGPSVGSYTRGLRNYGGPVKMEWQPQDTETRRYKGDGPDRCGSRWKIMHPGRQEYPQPNWGSCPEYFETLEAWVERWEEVTGEEWQGYPHPGDCYEHESGPNGNIICYRPDPITGIMPSWPTDPGHIWSVKTDPDCGHVTSLHFQPLGNGRPEILTIKYFCGWPTLTIPPRIPWENIPP